MRETGPGDALIQVPPATERRRHAPSLSTSTHTTAGNVLPSSAWAYPNPGLG